MQEAISFTPQLAASPIAEILWLIPAVPIVASGVIALLKQPQRKTCRDAGHRLAEFLAAAFAGRIRRMCWLDGRMALAVRETVNFTWIQVRHDQR